jgi:alpha-glucosidase
MPRSPLYALALVALALNGPALAQPPARADLFAAATPQLRVDQDGRQVVLTVLGERLIHIAYAPQIPAGKPYFSPMIAQRDFPGPVKYQWDEAAQKLTTASLTIVYTGGCWAIAGADAKPIERICVKRWRDDSIALSVAPAEASEVLGLGQKLDTEQKSPSWVGRERTPADTFGNAMTYSDIAASGDTQIPIAYLLGEGRLSHALFFDTPYPTRFAFTGKPWTVKAEGSAALGLFVLSAEDLPALRRDYLELTGRPPVPPLKAFGLWISEYGFDDWAELDDKLATLRDKRFPVDGAVLDLQWFGGIQSGSENTRMGALAWDTTHFPDPQAKLARYAEDGIGIVTIEESYVGAKRPEHEAMAKQRQLAMDCAPPCTEATRLTANPWWGVGGMIDWTNPEAGRSWHDMKRKALIAAGVLGHWTDLGEPEAFSAHSFYAGLDWYGERKSHHADIHNLYNFAWSRSIAEETARTDPQRRPWILSRSGTAGSQRFGVAMWSGDVLSSFASLGAQMTAQTNMSLSGFDYYGSDVGGFHRGGIARAALDRLYTRWFATSALLDVPLRPHVENLCNCTETAPDRIGDAPSNLAALALRYRLIPYLYSLAHAAHENGEPLFPPLAYFFQEDRAARTVSTTKMIGPWLLFATLADKGDSVTAYFPRGRWTDFRTPARLVDSTGSPQKLTVVEDGLTRAPLYLREGAIVPILARPPANLGSPRATGIHWFDDLLIRTVPAIRESRFTLVEDDGVTRAYEKGVTCRTAITARRTEDGRVQITLTPDNRTGESARRHLAIEVLGVSARQVRVNAETLAHINAGDDGKGWWLANDGIHIQLGTRGVEEAISVELAP